METEDAESSQSDDKPDVGGDYGYLLGMALYTLTEEKKEELLQKRDNKLAELKILQSKSTASMWKEDLDMFLERVSFCKIEHFF
jgi:DNA topoisomerase-2